jgi:hypothetical protein
MTGTLDLGRQGRLGQCSSRPGLPGRPRRHLVLRRPGALWQAEPGLGLRWPRHSYVALGPQGLLRPRLSVVYASCIVPSRRFVRDDHRDGAGALGRHGESISTIDAIVDKSVRGLVGGWVRAESRCHVVSKPHADTQDCGLGAACG